MFDDLDVYTSYLEEMVGFQRDYCNGMAPVGPGFEVINGDIENSLIVLRQIQDLRKSDIHNSAKQHPIPPVSERTP